MADKDTRIDPFDVAALEKSLNDSATRVSTIWVSFLIFSLYLLTAATTVTHRQLLLAEPVKLPVLNIDLPLWGFFFLAPILFVIFHAYVLIQVILLARTAHAYNEAIEKAAEKSELSTQEIATLRQRLANTLFAQMFAGSPRERSGWFGGLLQAIAQITLAIAPLLILLTFQFVFLPYHSHLATWAHRILILLEIAGIILLWPLALDGSRNFNWRKPWWRLKGSAAPARWRRGWWTGKGRWRLLIRHSFPAVAGGFFVLVPMSLATFPGEPHVNIVTGNALRSVQCKRSFVERYDRLDLSRVSAVDEEKLSKIVAAGNSRGLLPYEGARTRDLRDRELSCGIFDGADLRRVDLTRARLFGANLEDAELTGALLIAARLQGAQMRQAQLQSASFLGAYLGAAYMNLAQLQGAFMFGADLQGASLDEANLQGATLFSARLQGATFQGAKMQGATLDRVAAQYASFSEAQMQGVSLDKAQLQGANFARSALEHALIQDAFVWLAGGTSCSDARVISPKTDAVLEHRMRSDATVGRDVDESVSALDQRAVTKWIDDIAAQVPSDARESLRGRLSRMPLNELDWGDCWKRSEDLTEDQYDEALALYLRNFACAATVEREHIVSGFIRNWISDPESQSAKFRMRLASGLLGEDDRVCPATKDMNEKTKEKLRAVTVGAPAQKAMSDPYRLPRVSSVR